MPEPSQIATRAWPHHCSLPVAAVRFVCKYNFPPRVEFWGKGTGPHSLEREIKNLPKTECGCLHDGGKRTIMQSSHTTDCICACQCKARVWVHILGDHQSVQLRNAVFLRSVFKLSTHIKTVLVYIPVIFLLDCEPLWLGGPALGWQAEGPRFDSPLRLTFLL